MKMCQSYKYKKSFIILTLSKLCFGKLVKRCCYGSPLYSVQYTNTLNMKGSTCLTSSTCACQEGQCQNGDTAATLISTLNEVSNQLHNPAALSIGKRACYTLNWRLGPHSSSAVLVAEKNLLPLPVLQPITQALHYAMPDPAPYMANMNIQEVILPQHTTNLEATAKIHTLQK